MHSGLYSLHENFGLYPGKTLVVPKKDRKTADLSVPILWCSLEIQSWGAGFQTRLKTRLIKFGL
jgi:hypothetical protein